jgi:hypothetical protein
MRSARNPLSAAGRAYEKCPCQALERTQPGLPLGRGHVRTRPPAHGIITLFAALSHFEAKVLSPWQGAVPHAGISRAFDPGSEAVGLNAGRPNTKRGGGQGVLVRR